MRTSHTDPEYLARLQDYYARWRSVPAYDRLCELWGLASRSAAGKVLERLRQQEYLERTPEGTWIPTRRFFERFMARQAVQAGEPTAYSEPIPPLIPIQIVHLFRSNSSTDSV